MVGAHPPLRTVEVGRGSPLVILHGYAMQPETYLPLARLLADRAHVVIPAIFELQGPWRYGKALDALTATLDALELDRVSLLGHSFGGGLELGLAADRSDRVVECVFADTLGVNSRFHLAGEALRHPVRIMAMASPAAVGAFARSWTTHPLQLTEAAIWGFLSERGPDMDRIRRRRIRCHVMWASRDSLLSRQDGKEFARRLGATFTLAPGRGIDHDWMFDDPELFAAELMGLGLEVFSGPPSGPRGRTAAAEPRPGRAPLRGAGRAAGARRERTGPAE